MGKSTFKAIDIDGSGEIDYDEFFEMIKEPRSPYADSLFTLIDADGSGSIDFEEMMQVLATYCMYSKEDILTFCFDVFDKDGSGAIDEEEFMTLCKAVNNSNPMFPGNFSMNPYSKRFRGEMAEIKMKDSAKVADAGSWA